MTIDREMLGVPEEIAERVNAEIDRELHTSKLEQKLLKIALADARASGAAGHTWAHDDTVRKVMSFSVRGACDGDLPPMEWTSGVPTVWAIGHHIVRRRDDPMYQSVDVAFQRAEVWADTLGIKREPRECEPPGYVSWYGLWAGRTVQLYVVTNPKYLGASIPPPVHEARDEWRAGINVDAAPLVSCEECRATRRR